MVREPPVLPMIPWGAIVAGTVLTLAVTLLLTVLGVAIGLVTPGPTPGGVALAWAIITVLIAFFLGGWSAVVLAGGPAPSVALVIGLLVWATTTLVVLVLSVLLPGLLGLFAPVTPTLGAVTSPVVAAWTTLGVLIATLIAALLGAYLAAVSLRVQPEAVRLLGLHRRRSPLGAGVFL